MKVLWFSNSPANAVEYFNSEMKGSGSWLQALDKSLQNHVELHVAFLKEHNEVFKYKKTVYHSIYFKRSLYNKVLTRFYGNFATNDIRNNCLEIIKQVKPDVIHIHGTENFFIEIIAHTKTPVIVSIQGIITIISHKYCSGFEKKHLHIKKRSSTSLKNVFLPWTFDVQHKLFYNLGKFERKNLQMVKYLIGRTFWDRSVANILAPNSIYYHNDEILRDSFYKYSWSRHSRKKIIIHTTSSNDFYKGFETLSMALNLLNSNDFDCEWHVAGVANDDLIVKITKQKLKNNFPTKGLFLLGNLNQDKLIESMLNADMYVMTSHIENSSNALSEALLLGMPTISTFVGGVGTLIKDGEDGILIQDGDPWAMAGAIIELANNPGKSAKYGRNARKKSMIRHDNKKIVDELIDIYSDVLKQKDE